MFPELKYKDIELKKPKFNNEKLSDEDIDLLINELELRFETKKSIDWEVYNKNIFIGKCGIKYIDLQNNFAVLKLSQNSFIKKYFVNQNLKIILKLMINYCFKELKLNRIEIPVLDNNNNLINILKKNNFLFESIQYSKFKINEKYQNLYIYYQLNNQFKNNTKKNKKNQLQNSTNNIQVKKRNIPNKYLLFGGFGLTSLILITSIIRFKKNKIIKTLL